MQNCCLAAKQLACTHMLAAPLPLFTLPSSLFRSWPVHTWLGCRPFTAECTPLSSRTWGLLCLPSSLAASVKQLTGLVLQHTDVLWQDGRQNHRWANC